jgi:2-hydroxychromene-2-carboxylate isomerase
MSPIQFFFDVGSPYAYLAAERLQGVVGPAEVQWQPVLLGGLFKLTGRSSWALGDPRRRQSGMAEIEARAQRYGLSQLVWPDPWPGDYLFAMRVVSYGFARGRGEELARALLRAAFTQGVNLSLPAEGLAVAERAGWPRAELQAAAEDPAVKRALRESTDRAHALGVFGVPTIAVGTELFWGDDRLEDAAAALA